MKTHYSLKLLIFFHFFILGIPALSAQSDCSSWPLDSHAKVTEEIFACCSNIIGIRKEKLEGFLLENDAELYNPSIKAPCPTTSALPDPEEFYFSWEAIPDATHYLIRYLNLRTGESNETSTTDTDFTLPNGSSDNYLFLFSTLTDSRLEGIQKSGNYIIIDEKLIIITYPPRDDSMFRKTVQKVNSTTLRDLKIVPNPSQGMTYLTYDLDSFQEVSIQVIDVLGRVQQIVQSPTPQLPGHYQVMISGDQLPPGNYYCRIKTNREIRQLPLIKQ